MGHKSTVLKSFVEFSGERGGGVPEVYSMKIPKGCFDARLAAETFEEAAEAAMEEMKGKLATRYRYNRHMHDSQHDILVT